MKKNLLLSVILFLASSLIGLKSFAQVSFTTSPNSGCRPLVVTVTNTSVGVPANYEYRWNFYDGTPIVTNINPTSFTHTFTAAGNYWPRVDVYDNLGGFYSSYNGSSVQVNGLQSINAPDSVCPGDAANFCASTGQGGNFSTFWKFGDGSTYNSNQTCANHTYTAQTTYTVTLIAAAGGCPTDSLKKTIKVTPNAFPNANWWANLNGGSACPNQQIGFNCNPAASYTWNFGDGGTSNIQQPQHAYTSTVNATYTVSLIIENVCGKRDTATGTVVVNNNTKFPNQPWFSVNVNGSPGCPGSRINFNAPNGYGLYQWNFGDNSPIEIRTDDHNDHKYGTAIANYTVSVKITNACGNDTTLYKVVQIVANAPFPNQSWFALQSSGATCLGDNGYIEAPDGFVSYLWDFGGGDSAFTTDGRASHSYTTTGTHTVSCKITNGCGDDTTITGTIVVDNIGSFPNYIGIDVSPSTGSCPNDIVGFRINSGEYTSYLWIFGDGDTAFTTGTEIQHTYTGTATYTLSCKITNGCGLTTTVYSSIAVTGTSPVSPSLYLDATQNPSCPGDDVFLNPQEGQSTYQYIWHFGDGSPADTTIGTGAVHSYTAVGNYTTTVTAKNGCGLTKTVSVVDTINNTTFPSLVGSNGKPIWGFPGSEGGSNEYAGCSGDAIIFYFIGNAANNVWNFGDGNSGTAAEHMLIFGGEGESYPVTIIKYSYAANGTYTVSLTLTNGCGKSTTGSMVIKIGGNQLVNGDITTSPPPFSTCAPINFIGFGGATYAWDFGDGTSLNTTSPTVSHTFSSAGVYAVSALITNGCGNSATYSKSVSVSGVGGPAVVLSSSVTPTCVGSSNGSATVNVTSGQMPYTYLWNDTQAQTAAAATGLHAGIYNAVVTDGFGCPTNLIVQLYDPAPVVLSHSTTSTACGSATGTAAISVTSGGSTPYTYSWSNGGTAASTSGLALGIYNVQVTDSKGCSASSNVSISEASSATVTLTSSSNPNCNAGANGSINITVAGGTPPYVYAWSNGSTVQDPAGLMAGSYSVLITDNGSCKATFNTSISQPTAVVAATSVVTAPTCGNFDGKATVSASGGTGAYTYLWDANTGGKTTQSVTGLPAGSYSVQVTDANGCIGNGIVSLSNSNAPLLSAAVSDVSCFGGSNGSVNLSVAGGTAPYLYTWNVGPPQTNNQDVFGLTPGSYFVSVSDSKGCLSFQLYTIGQPAVLTASVTNTGATCGNNNGTATANVTGGNTSFTYIWTGGQSTQTATGLALGNYSVTVTDNKGCSVSSTTSVTPMVMPIDICGVTVDNTSTKNVIVWEKPVSTIIDSFRIYRNIATVFTYVGAVAYQDSSYFIDNTAGVNPNTTSYQYKMKALDNCGNQSVFSSFHQTIHLAVGVAAPPKTYNLTWTDYLGFQITQYRILVDSLNNGNWKVRDSVPYGNPKQWSDIYHYPNDTVGYMIEIAHPTGCIVSSKNPDPMAANLNLSKSNINKIADSTGTPHVANIKNELGAFLYPNPSNGIFTIELKEQPRGPVMVKVFNMLGEEVTQASYTAAKNKISMDLSKQTQGVYYIHISSSEKTTTRKIILD